MDFTALLTLLGWLPSSFLAPLLAFVTWITKLFGL